jgi:hypothetical protein
VQEFYLRALAGDVAERLPKHRAQRSFVYLIMKDDRERLSDSSWKDAM